MNPIDPGIEEGEGIPDRVAETARRVFGIQYLFPWQHLVIANILEAKDWDGWAKQIVLLPTGAGKSLCFLLPAVLLPGPTLIIYPLLALMADQKRRMDEAGLDAVVFRGGQTPEEREDNFRRLAAGAKIILATPEVLQSDSLLERLASCSITFAAIDEAHCVSEWGDSFRPAYLTLGTILAKLNVPVAAAFTATASEPVLRRIGEVLFDGEAHIVRGEADRPNIRYRVQYAYAKEKAALALAIEAEKPLIVFCGTRNRAEQCARLFASYFGYESDMVRFYHAGLTREEKKRAEDWFFSKKDGILCATCAFGMGVDKPDIRTVIHLDPPATVEAYVQEAGRGGRDGKDAQAVLLWGPADRKKYAAYPAGSRERGLFDFAGAGTCRRQILLDALGGEQAACAGCDVCNGTAEKGAADAEEVLRFFRRNGTRYPVFEAANLLSAQANCRDAEKFGMRIWERGDYQVVIDALAAEKRLVLGKWLWKDRVVRTPLFSDILRI